MILCNKSLGQNNITIFSSSYVVVITTILTTPCNSPSEYYYAKPMPSAGYVPFVQSLLCDPISGRPEIRLEHASPYKKYSGARLVL